jgi:enamine deaminase RidA (YjgF/YER057c/UK114 family)/uncharacterized damage-inducible protein DinB
MTAEELKVLEESLPQLTDPAGAYVHAVRTGNHLYLAGKGVHVSGKVGREFTREQAYQFARETGRQLLAAIKQEVGSLQHVKRVVKVLGMVNATPDFGDHPFVINGCSDLFIEVFGEAGRHARSAVGMASLPHNIPIEIEAIVEVVSPDAPATQIFLDRARHLLLTEYRTKIRLAVEAMPEEMIWRRANEKSNSVGNLLLHLNGNVRQWLVSGVGGATDIRNRASEFSAAAGPSRRELLTTLNETLDAVSQVLASMSGDALLQGRTIQGREVTVLDAIFHCVEHFSLHLGQIILMAKMSAPGAIQFYEDAGGLARPIWKEKV